MPAPDLQRSLRELAQQRRLPAHQPMDPATLAWIESNRPVDFDTAPSFPRPGQMLVPPAPWFTDEQRAESNHGIRHNARASLYASSAGRGVPAGRRRRGGGVCGRCGPRLPAPRRPGRSGPWPTGRRMVPPPRRRSHQCYRAHAAAGRAAPNGSRDRTARHPLRPLHRRPGPLLRVRTAPRGRAQSRGRPGPLPLSPQTLVAGPRPAAPPPACLDGSGHLRPRRGQRAGLARRRRLRRRTRHRPPDAHPRPEGGASMGSDLDAAHTDHTSPLEPRQGMPKGRGRIRARGWLARCGGMACSAWSARRVAGRQRYVTNVAEVCLGRGAGLSAGRRGPLRLTRHATTPDPVWSHGCARCSAAEFECRGPRGYSSTVERQGVADSVRQSALPSLRRYSGTCDRVWTAAAP